MRNDRNCVSFQPKNTGTSLCSVACLHVIGAVLVELDVVTMRCAVAAVLASIAYVLLTTWDFTREQGTEP